MHASGAGHSTPRLCRRLTPAVHVDTDAVRTDLGGDRADGHNLPAVAPRHLAHLYARFVGRVEQLELTGTLGAEGLAAGQSLARLARAGDAAYMRSL